MKFSSILVLVLMIAAIAAFLLIDERAQSAPALQSPPTLQDRFIAAQASRQRRDAAVNQARVTAAESGYEHGLAGFHLLRPSDDLTWTDTMDNDCTGSFCWDFAQPRYRTVVYCSKRMADGELISPPIGNLGPLCQISVFRSFANQLATLSIEDEPAGMKRVIATFDRRALAALGVMLQPASNEPVNGRLDWFGIPRDGTTPDTDMRVVLVSEDYCYHPISISDLVVQGPGPVSIVVATGLTSSDADELRAKYER